MTRYASHVIASTDEALCGTRSFAALALSHRDQCLRCTRDLDTILYALDAFSRLAGSSDLVATDKRLQRALDILALAYGNPTEGAT